MSNRSLVDLLAPIKVMPVVTIGDAATAVPLAKALLAGGVPAIEITLRTSAALDATRRIAEAVPEMLVGVGTVLAPQQLLEAAAAGARFAVSPGTTSRLLDVAADSPLPLLPGVATPSEVMTALDRGYELLKFFPAETLGGRETLRAWAGPLPAARFCPTGGIGRDAVADYLALPNVVCVGGSWLTPSSAIAAGDYATITDLARAASQIGG